MQPSVDLKVLKTLVPEDQRALRILLAEDSEDNRLLIQSYLKKTPYQIDIAENGEIAVEKFISEKYDLVLMDMQMPVMDGYTATKAIRKWERENEVKATPIIALTAYALKEDKQKSLEAGCTAHLIKPIKKQTLIETIYSIYQECEAMAQNSDEKQADKIIVHVDAELEDLIPGFLENRHKDVKSMLEALEQTDYDTIRVLGHSMKGSGGGYGFDAVTDIGKSLEEAAGERDSEEIRKLVGELLTYIERVEVFYE
jgi:CheY-like chemotaxis protein